MRKGLALCFIYRAVIFSSALSSTAFPHSERVSGSGRPGSVRTKGSRPRILQWSLCEDRQADSVRAGNASTLTGRGYFTSAMTFGTGGCEARNTNPSS
jgi:hypothetical protein